MDATTKTAFCVMAVIAFLAIVISIKIYISAHILGTFKFDNTGNTYRCRMEFEDLDELENLKFAIVKIKEADLSLPGEKYPRD